MTTTPSPLSRWEALTAWLDEVDALLADVDRSRAEITRSLAGTSAMEFLRQASAAQERVRAERDTARQVEKDTR